jgi:Glycosyltransferase sugar-binding region containing DXD motif
MERLSLSSFLKTGHDVHLYTYEDVKNIPSGVVVKDGNEIIDHSFLDYRKFINHGTFADFFRYALLLKRGGWWVDSDIVALKPFDFPEHYVFGCMGPYPYPEPVNKVRGLRRPPRPDPPDIEEKWPGAWVCNAVMKAPAGSWIMKYLWDECLQCDPANIRWSEQVGPKLLDKAVRKFSLHDFVKNTKYFNPIAPEHVRQFVDPDITWDLPGHTYAIHFWNDMWSGRLNYAEEETWKITGCPPILQNKEIVVKGSLYGNLVERYLS